MKTTLCMAILPALVFALSAEALAHAPDIPPPGSPSSASDSVPADGDARRVRAYPLVFDAGDARAALERAFAERRQGKVVFSLRGAGIDRDITADCDVTAARAASSGAMPEAPPSAIACRFREAGRSLPARLELRESGSDGRSEQAGVQRHGVLRIDGLALQIAASDSSGAVQAADGLSTGYRFTVDGVAVGSVELAGRPRVRFAAGTDKRTQRAVMLGATALGVLWSPQSTAAPRLAQQRAPR